MDFLFRYAQKIVAEYDVFLQVECEVLCYASGERYAPSLQVRGEQKHSVGKHSRMNYERPCPRPNHLRSSHCISTHTSVILWSFQALPKFCFGTFL